MITLAIAAPHLINTLEETVKTGLIQSGDPNRASSGELKSLMSWSAGKTLSAVAPVSAAAAVFGVLASLAQVGSISIHRRSSPTWASSIRSRE